MNQSSVEYCCPIFMLFVELRYPLVVPLKVYDGPGSEDSAPLALEVTPDRTTASLLPTRSFPPCAAVPPSRQYSDAPSSITASA